MQSSTFGVGNKSVSCYPFVKWAGGKNQILPRLQQFIPSEFTSYIEPFVGGGALFFDLVSKKKFSATLSDINEDLINSYRVIKNHVDELIAALQISQKEYRKDPKKYFYKLRAEVSSLNNIKRAARFITLNKTCYNGLYRVNNNGLFNVPIGRYKNPLICDMDNLRKMSVLLRQPGSYLGVSDYKKILLEKATKGDFIYLDPPFHPISSNANFTSYTDNGFTFEDQKELAVIFKELTRRECKILLSNSDTNEIRKLYSDFSHLTEVASLNRSINSVGSKRIGHKELLIKNYEL